MYTFWKTETYNSENNEIQGRVKKKKLVVIIPDTTISSVACTEPSQEDNIISGSMSRGLASETNLGRHPGGEAR